MWAVTPALQGSAFDMGMIFDSVIAPWFLAAAPSFLRRPHAAMRAAGP
jgi:hypothetical protein